jgi:predicted dehydrogenase
MPEPWRTSPRGAETVVRIGFTMRRAPGVAAIRELIAFGTLGRVLHVDGRYWCDYACDPMGPISWRYKGAPGSGALADIGSHVAYLIEFLGGDVQEVSGGRFTTAIKERPVPLGTVVGHGHAELSDTYEPVENDDYASFSARLEEGIARPTSASSSTPRTCFGSGWTQLPWYKTSARSWSTRSKGRTHQSSRCCLRRTRQPVRRLGPDEPRTNLGGDEWANEWPKDAAWDFVALGRGHDAVFWSWLAALHVVDPDMLVNIEHEDVALGRIEGLEVASAVLLDVARRAGIPTAEGR